jgi:multiple sugar transport system permease protein
MTQVLEAAAKTGKLLDRTAARVGRRRLRGLAPYLCLTPAIILLAVFIVGPVISVFYYSTQNYNPTEPYLNGSVGLGNYTQIFAHDPIFWSSLEISAKWVVSEVVLQFVLGLGLALLLNSKFRLRGLARAITFSPWAVSGVAVTSMWTLMYNPFGGIFNTVLKDTGLSNTPVQWLSDSHILFGSVVTAELWRGIPFFAILMLASLQAIPEEIYEAARVDGAGRWRTLFQVTLPLLRDTIVLACLLRAVWEFKDVDVIFTMTDGGPANQTTTLPVYIANEAIKLHNFGYGSALTVTGFLILVALTLVYLRITRFGRES